MTFDRFDICEAWYLYLCDYHGGQWSKEYNRLSRMTAYFKPRNNLSFGTLSENAQDIYRELEYKRQPS